jgi:DNA-binding GntR family transcriptional regulator
VGDGLVEFEVNRGFFVAEFGLDVVLERLEARLLLEPQIARLAAARRTEADLAALREAIGDERVATTSDAAHDASRSFHLALAAATQNDQLWRLIDGLWIADVGRRLLARRYATPTWQADDAHEHEEILAAIQAGDGDAAEVLVQRHDEEALRHWSDRRSAV